MTAVDYNNGVVISSGLGTTILWYDGTIVAGQVSANVAHGLGILPVGYSVAPTNIYAVGVRVTAITGSTITVAIGAAQDFDATVKVGVST